MEEELQQLRTNASSDLMSDEDFISQIESMSVEAQEREINDLLKAMHESRIVSWDEAERILQETDRTPIKCSLPEQTRPTEPDNEVDVDTCIRKLLDNDPSLKEVNLNNMKRTPVPAIKRLLEALAYNEHCERISLANMGLYDHDIMVLVTVIEMNQAIKKVNLETNYLSGEFFSKLFKAALNNETVEEIKAVNQGVSFSTQSEKEIIDSIVKNKGLTKISINFRLPEGRHKVENATLRNGEYKRIKRREAALKAKQEQEELEKNPVPKLAPEKPPAPTPAPAPTPKVHVPAKMPFSLVTPEPPPKAAAPPPTIIQTVAPKPTILAKQLSFQRASREDEEETELVSIPEPKKVEIPKMFQNAGHSADDAPKVKKTGKVWKPVKIEASEPESAMPWRKKLEVDVVQQNGTLVENGLKSSEVPKKTLKSPISPENGRKSPARNRRSPVPPKNLRRSPEPRSLKSPEVAHHGRKSPEPPRRLLKSPEGPHPGRKSPEPSRRNLKSPVPPPQHLRKSPEPSRRTLKSPEVQISGRKSPEPPRRTLKSPEVQHASRKSPEPSRRNLKSPESPENPPTQARSAKNMWEHRMAKLQQKEQQKTKKPLLSIQQIREMEKNNVFEQKIKVRKPKIMENAATETTVIRRTVMRQRQDETNA